MPNKTCIQCHKELTYAAQLIPEYPTDRVYVTVCRNPECPNYGLVAIPQEDMPKETE